MTEEKKSTYFVHSVAKAFEVLKAFDSGSNTLSLRDLEQKTGINKATVRRFALTLVDLGYLRMPEEHRFQLSPKVLELGSLYLENLTLPDLAYPILERISVLLRETTNLAVLDDAEVVYVSRVNAAERIIGVNLQVGSRLPYYATSLGKALVAWLPAQERKRVWKRAKVEAFTANTITDFARLEQELATCRRQGYAYSSDELEVGLRSVAVPIFNRKQEPIAALNISTHSLRTSEEKVREVYLPVLLEAAQELNRQIRHHPRLI